MEKCKTIEARLEIWKTIFNVWSLFTLAWGGALGTLLFKAPQKIGLVTASAVGISIFSIIWAGLIIGMFSEVQKLNECKEEK
jgi:hypothetical protein